MHDSLDDVRNFYSRCTGEVIVGIEACGYSEWFERSLRFVVLIGGPLLELFIGPMCLST